MRLVVVLWSILAAVVAHVKCTDVDDESSSEAKPLIVDGAPEITDELRAAGVTEETFKRVVRWIPPRKGDFVKIVRTDTFPSCGRVVAKRLRAELKNIKLFARNVRRLEQYQKIIGDVITSMPYLPLPVATFSTEAPQSTSTAACQLITEVEARERGKADDGKCVVDVSEGCWVRQSLRTHKGSHYFDEKLIKKFSCGVLLAMADAVATRTEDSKFYRGKWDLQSTLPQELFDTIPCHIVKTKVFGFEKGQILFIGSMTAVEGVAAAALVGGLFSITPVGAGALAVASICSGLVMMGIMLLVVVPKYLERSDENSRSGG